jgi:predicted nucleotidyltransferase
LLPLGPGYGDLYDRLEAALAEQPGFIALTLGGSVLSGDADVHSDLDLVVEATDPATFDAPAAVAAATPTVLRRTLAAPPRGCKAGASATRT